MRLQDNRHAIICLISVLLLFLTSNGASRVILVIAVLVSAWEAFTYSSNVKVVKAILDDPGHIVSVEMPKESKGRQLKVFWRTDEHLFERDLDVTLAPGSILLVDDGTSEPTATADGWHVTATMPLALLGAVPAAETAKATTLG